MDSPDPVHADPRTHALLMGVGKYPHLTGADAVERSRGRHAAAQFTPSPTRAIADWLTEYRFPGQAAGQSFPLAQ